MKIKDIAEGWWSQALGALSPRSGNRYDIKSHDEYKKADDVYLSKLRADVESGKIDPSTLASGDKQAINPDPSYWAKKQLDYTNKGQSLNAYNVLKPNNVNVSFGQSAQTKPAKPQQTGPMSYGGAVNATLGGTGQTYSAPSPKKPRMSVRAATGPAPAPDDPSTMSPEERRKYYNNQFKSGIKVSANRG